MATLRNCSEDGMPKLKASSVVANEAF